jgi:hypothetical protein
MAAKKAPAKKMAAPKAAPKRTSKTADSSKLTASQKKNLAASAKMRKDALGNTGMGRTGLSGNELVKLGLNASQKAINNSKQNSSAIGFYKAQQEGANAFNKSIRGNASYTVQGNTPAKKQLKEIIAASNRSKKKK